MICWGYFPADFYSTGHIFAITAVIPWWLLERVHLTWMQRAHPTCSSGLHNAGELNYLSCWHSFQTYQIPDSASAECARTRTTGMWGPLPMTWWARAALHACGGTTQYCPRYFIFYWSVKMEFIKGTYCGLNLKHPTSGENINVVTQIFFQTLPFAIKTKKII